jgi:phosphatidate cytidylyltransferase
MVTAGDPGWRIPDTTRGGRPSGSREAVRRVLATVLFAPLFYLLVRYLPPATFFGLITAVAILAAREFYRLFWSDHPWPLGTLVGCMGIAALLCSTQWPAVISERFVLLLTVFIALALPLVTARDLRRAVLESAVLLTGVLYLGLTLSCLLFTRSLPDGEFLVFFVVLVTWAGDTGAYILGKTLGRHPLAPRISPKKTIEGLVGGAALALVVALLSRAWFLPWLTWWDAVVLAGLLTAAGLLGDLVESAMKRSVQQKDSGALIPGHGGMLDRVDSLLFTAPCFYYYVVLVKGN